MRVEPKYDKVVLNEWSSMLEKHAKQPQPDHAGLALVSEEMDRQVADYCQRWSHVEGEGVTKVEPNIMVLLRQVSFDHIRLDVYCVSVEVFGGAQDGTQVAQSETLRMFSLDLLAFHRLFSSV